MLKRNQDREKGGKGDGRKNKKGHPKRDGLPFNNMCKLNYRLAILSLLYLPASSFSLISANALMV